MTAGEAFVRLKKLQDDYKAYEAKLSPTAPDADEQRRQAHAGRFTISKAAANLWRSLTPEGRRDLKAKAHAVIKDTPPLVNATAKVRGWRIGHAADGEAQHLLLPNGKVAPGVRLGQEKARLGWKDADHAKRMEILQQLKVNRVHLNASEVRDALDQAKPFPADKIKEKYAKAEAARAKGKLPETKVKTPLGYLGQTDAQVASYLSKLQPSFDAGDVETQLIVLDKVSDLSSALESKDSGAMTEAEVLEVMADPPTKVDPLTTVEQSKTDGSGIHPAIFWVGGAVVLGLVLYFVLRKRPETV
jgi:hypothetical protein